VKEPDPLSVAVNQTLTRPAERFRQEFLSVVATFSKQMAEAKDIFLHREKGRKKKKGMEGKNSTERSGNVWVKTTDFPSICLCFSRKHVVT